jgi:hypothetical protein
VISPAHRAMAMDTEFGGGLHRSVHGVLPFVAFT